MSLAVLALAMAGWVAAPGPGKEVCDGVQREPIVKLGPKGAETEYPKPTGCRIVDKDKSPTWYGDMTPTQQTVPAGTPCLQLKTVDHFTYGLTEPNGTMWAKCQRRQP